MKNNFYTSVFRGEVDAITAIRSRKDIVSMIASLHRRGVNALWGIGIMIMPDEKDTETYTLYLVPGAVGLPGSEYYLSGHPYYAGIREMYALHIQAMFKLAEISMKDDSSISDIVMNIEAALARTGTPGGELQDEEKTYIKKTRQELSVMTPDLDWDTYFSGIGVEGEYDCFLEAPDFFAEVNSLVEGLSLEEWQAYLIWKLLHSMAPCLGDGFAKENFSFYGILSGPKNLM